MLLSKMKSVKRIREANLETLEEILGKVKPKWYSNILTETKMHKKAVINSLLFSIHYFF